MPKLHRLLLPAATLAALLIPASARGQDAAASPGEPRTPPKTDYIAGANTKLIRALDEVIPEVQFQDTPFEQVMDFLQELAKINMTVYWADLEEHGVPRDKPVSFRTANLPLKVVLTEVLDLAGGDVALGYAIRDGVVRIATEEKLKSEPELLTDLNLSNVPLPEVIDFLRAADPSLKVVLASDPGVSVDQVVISELRLSNVTASQVLQALQIAYPQIQVMNTTVPPAAMKPGSGDLPTLWTVRVTPVRTPRSDRESSVFRLREAIDQLQRDSQATDRAAARAAVLQLVEAALRLSVGDRAQPERPELQVHEPTETLIFRGTRAEMNLVAGALNALRPAYGARNPVMDQLLRRVAALEQKLGIAPEPADVQTDASPAAETPAAGPASGAKPAAPEAGKEKAKTPQ